MNNNLTNLEQPINSSQGEGFSQIDCGAEEVTQGSKLGKFKNAQALLQAYNNLQADYTKKCQTLANLEKEAENNANINSSWQENAKSFFEANPRAKKYENELAHIIVQDKAVASSQSPLNEAWSKFVNSKFLDESELANNPNFLQNHIFNNEQIKNKIITDYFNSLNFTDSPTLITNQKGSASVLSPQVKPKTIKEARKIVEDFFN